jgi:VWFA-related protein
MALSLLAQETVTVHVVEVPVTVLDRDGNPVRGLKPGNFELFDDGKRQTITAFDAIDFASMASVSAISPINPNARRSFLLLFDLGYSDIKSIQRAREAAKGFLNANVQPRDLVSVGSIDPEKGFQLLTAFTTDRNMVAAAIAKPRTYQGADPLQLSDLDAFGNNIGGAVAPFDPNANSADADNGHGAEAEAERAEIAEMTNKVNRDYAVGRVISQIQSLGMLASMLRSVPGRKQVVLLSGGFDPALVRGRSARGAMGREMSDMQKATSGQAYNIDNDARFGSTQSLNVLDEMNKIFKQSDVVLNAIDIAGIVVDGDTSKPRGSNVSNDGLHLLADATGGTVFENSNDMHANFDRMMREQEVVYVLAFQAAASKAGKAHNLTVKAVDVPGARVHNRLAYYEGGGGETSAQRVLTNAEIIMNDLPQRDIRVASLAAAVPAANRAAVALFLEINGQDLLHDTTKATPADIFVYAFDEQGIVRDRLYQRINVDPAKASDAVKQNGIKYFATLAVPPGRYAIKALVTMPGTERRGFSRTELVVPAQNDMAVMPLLFFDKPGQWAMLKGVQRDSAPYPFLLNGEPFVPSVSPTFHAAEEREFALFLYNAAAEDMMMQATVTDASGMTHPATPALTRQIQGEGVTKLVFQYQPAGLPAGPATLDLTLHKKGSADIHHASIPLMVAGITPP